MLNRRDLCVILAGAAAGPQAVMAQAARLPFYASTGPNLTHYDLDVAAARLTPRGTVTLPANVQYAWPDPARRFLYVAASNNRPGAEGVHRLAVFRIGADGALTPHGAAVTLRQRPVHFSLDHGGRYLLTAYNLPSAVSVHAIHADGTVGAEVIQQQALDTGIYAHQIRATPTDATVVLITRGNDPRPGIPEDPGALKIYRFRDGQLSNLQSLAPRGNGIGFGPRHLDFTPDGRFAAVSLERENSIGIWRLEPDGRFGAEPLFLKNALRDPDAKAKYPGQTAGPIHVHPGGRFIYQTNRGSGTIEQDGRRISNGGENNVVVWAFDPATGEPSLIQHAPAHGFELRTFAVDPGGSLLVAASQVPMLVREGGAVTSVSAGLSLYRIGADGKLTFTRKQDVDTSAGPLFWSGLLTMP